MSDTIHKPDAVESLFDDGEGGEFWWKHCSVEGCKAMENRAAATGMCHVHTYTGLHHKIARAWRKLLWRLLHG